MRSKFEWRAPESVAALVLLVAVSIVMPALAVGQGSEEPGLVTGTITTAEPLSPSSNAVAVVTIVDRSAGGDDVILGQQRRADPGPTPITFKVAYDPARIQADHAYVVFAAIMRRWGGLAERGWRSGHQRRPDIGSLGRRRARARLAGRGGPGSDRAKTTRHP